MKNKIKCSLLFIMFMTISYGQIKEYKNKRALTGISEQWSKIVLPDDIYTDVQNDLDDIRIYGFKDNDTIEAPYLLKEFKDKHIQEDVSFKMLNETNNSKGYYYTFQLDKLKLINQFDLSFSIQNYDLKVNLEGSHNQNEWFMISENQRVAAIQNSNVDFEYSKINFKDTKYKFYRLLVKSKSNPKLNNVSITVNTIVKGNTKEHTVKSFNVYKENKNTIISIGLEKPVSINEFKVNITDDFDYIRPIEIEYLKDSTKYNTGWKENYNSLLSSTLSSIKENKYLTRNRISQKFKITIYNRNNQPLNVKNVAISGSIFELHTRTTIKDANYFLVYGNKDAYKPQYDILKFENKIPKKIKTLNNGEIEKITNKSESLEKKQPLFTSRWWLWGILIVFIGLLGWFSIGMLKKPSEEE